MSKYGDVREQSADPSIYPFVVVRVEKYQNGVWMSKHDRVLMPGEKPTDLPPGIEGVRYAQDLKWLMEQNMGDF